LPRLSKAKAVVSYDSILFFFMFRVTRNSVVCGRKMAGTKSIKANIAGGIQAEAIDLCSNLN